MPTIPITPTSVQKITEARKAEREAMAWEHRSYRALELIADTLEAMRADGIGVQHHLAAIARKPSE